jgi:hypothetical protein
MSPLKDWVLPLLAAVIVSFITARLSLRQFRSQRWWERQAEAYSSIMEKLTLLQYLLGLWYDDALDVGRIPEAGRDELNRRFAEAREGIIRAAAAGSYIISATAADALARLAKALEKQQGDWFREIGEHFAAVKEAIARIRECAKKDLGKDHHFLGELI